MTQPGPRNKFLAMSELFQKTLIEGFLLAKSKNRAFSKRAYAKKLGVSSGALTEFLAGKRSPSKESLKRILERLHIDHPVKEEIWAKTTLPKRTHFQPMEENQYEILSDWIHFALLSLLNTKNFSFEAKDMAQRLNVSEARIQMAWNRLMDVGLIEIKKGRATRTKAAINSSENIKTMAIQNYHHSLLEKAQDVLQTLPVQDRDFCALTFPFSSEDLPWLQNEVRILTEKIIKKSKSKKHAHVFQFNTQAFPLTKPTSKKESEK